MTQFRKGQSGNPNGRPTGAKNKVSEDLREVMSDFLQHEFDVLKKKVVKLSPKDRMRFFSDCLPFVIPKLQTTTLTNDIGQQIENLSSEQLDQLMNKILDHYNSIT